MNQQLVAQSHLIEQLSQRHAELLGSHQTILEEVARVQKTVLNHEHVIQDVMTFLHSLDKQRRNDGTDPASQPISMLDDLSASPLQHASKLLNDLNAEMQLSASSMDHLRDLLAKGPAKTPTPPADGRPRPANGNAHTTVDFSSNLGYPSLNGELDHVVYPMGITNGIDPMFGEHVNNIPYPMPPKDVDPSDPRRPSADGRKKNTFADPGWRRSPRILLVEDDQTCRQIGGKFLYSFCCAVDSAVSLQISPSPSISSLTSLSLHRQTLNYKWRTFC